MNPRDLTRGNKLYNIQKVFFENAKTKELRKFNFVLMWDEPRTDGGWDETSFNKYVELFGYPDKIIKDKRLVIFGSKVEILIYKKDISSEIITCLASSKNELNGIWTKAITKFIGKIILYPDDMNEQKGLF